MCPDCRQWRFACLSLKIGSIITAVFFILYSVLVLTQCTAALCELASQTSVDKAEYVLGVVVAFPQSPQHHYPHWVMMGIVIAITIGHSVTLFFTALMLVGVLREKLYLIRPWVVVTWIQLVMCVVFAVRLVVKNFTSLSDGNTLLMYGVAFLRLLLRFFLLTLVATYCEQLEKEQLDGKRVKTLVHQDTKYNSV